MPPRFLLRLRSGERAGESFPIPPSGLLIGRRAGNDVRLEDPSLSGRHALVRFDGTHVLVEDLGSTNGTRVDGEKVERAQLEAGARLVLGKVEFVLEQEGAPGAATESGAEAEPPGGLELEGLDDEIRLDAPDVPSAPEIPAVSVPPRESRPSRRASPSAAGDGGVDVDETFDETFDEDGVLGTIDASAVVGRRSRGGLLAALGVFAVAAGAAGWFFLSGGSAEEDLGAGEVAAVEGNRLGTGFSFEGEAGQGGWSADEAAPRRFARTRGAAVSGRLGLGLEPLAGEWARTSSEAVAVRADQVVEGIAQASAGGGAIARIGLELSAADGAAPPAYVWSDAAGVEPGELRVAARVCAPHDRVRLLLHGGAWREDPPAEDAAESGSCAFDDAVLRDADDGVLGIVRVGEFELETSAGAATVARLARLGRSLLDLRVAEASNAAAQHALVTASDDGADDGAVRLSLRGGGARPRVILDLLPELFGDGARSIGCLGEDGYRERSGAFELEGVHSMRLGDGLDQALLVLPESTRVTGEPRGEGLRVTAPVPSGAELVLRLSFTAERAQAATLAAQARRAERDGDLGLALARWGELLREHPFEAELVAEAGSTAGRVAQEGLVDLRDVELDVERAAFFGLSELYVECAERARAVAQRYRSPAGAGPNDVERAARQLIESVEAALAALPGDDDARRAARRAAVLESLQRAGKNALAERLASAQEQSP